MIDHALAVVNAGAATCRGPLRHTLYSLKAAVLQRLIESGATVRYLYRYTKPTIDPRQEHPDLLEMEGGIYHWDLLEIELGDRAFHIPVPLASRMGLLQAIRGSEMEYVKRKSRATGSKASLSTPPTKELTSSVSDLVEWLVRTENVA